MEQDPPPFQLAIMLQWTINLNKSFGTILAQHFAPKNFLMYSSALANIIYIDSPCINILSALTILKFRSHLFSHHKASGPWNILKSNQSAASGTSLTMPLLKMRQSENLPTSERRREGGGEFNAFDRQCFRNRF